MLYGNEIHYNDVNLNLNYAGVEAYLKEKK